MAWRGVCRLMTVTGEESHTGWDWDWGWGGETQVEFGQIRSSLLAWYGGARSDVTPHTTLLRH
jgi:hypothetical protein